MNALLWYCNHIEHSRRNILKPQEMESILMQRNRVLEEFTSRDQWLKRRCCSIRADLRSCACICSSLSVNIEAAVNEFWHLPWPRVMYHVYLAGYKVHVQYTQLEITVGILVCIILCWFHIQGYTIFSITRPCPPVAPPARPLALLSVRPSPLRT